MFKWGWISTAGLLAIFCSIVSFLFLYCFFQKLPTPVGAHTPPLSQEKQHVLTQFGFERRVEKQINPFLVSLCIVQMQRIFHLESWNCLNLPGFLQGGANLPRAHVNYFCSFVLILSRSDVDHSRRNFSHFLVFMQPSSAKKKNKRINSANCGSPQISSDSTNGWK